MYGRYYIEVEDSELRSIISQVEMRGIEPLTLRMRTVRTRELCAAWVRYVIYTRNFIELEIKPRQY